MEVIIFCLKKSEFNKATSAQWFNFDNLLYILSIFQQCKIIKVESLYSSCLSKFWLFFLTKKWWLLFKAKKKFPDGTSLRPGWIVPLLYSHSCWFTLKKTRLIYKIQSKISSSSLTYVLFTLETESEILVVTQNFVGQLEIFSDVKS